MPGRSISLDHHLAIVAIALGLAGCGNAEREAQLQIARESVVAGLEAWKRGEPADALRTGDNPIEFHDDDWQQSAKLNEYEVLTLYHETDNTPRCAVLLKIEPKGGQQVERKVTYQVLTDPKVIIARDPFS